MSLFRTIRNVTGAVAGTALAGGIIAMIATGAATERRKLAYLREQLPIAMAEQEQFIGVHQTGTPHLNLRVVTLGTYIMEAGAGTHTLGSYDGTLDDITVEQTYLQYPGEADSVSRKGIPYQSAAAVLKHEVGHRAAWQRAQQLKIDGWPRFTENEMNVANEWQWTAEHAGFDYNEKRKDSTLTVFWTANAPKMSEMTAKAIISEGTAEYIGVLGTKPDSVEDSCVQSDIRQVTEKDPVGIRYRCGYHIVKPILDAHGRDGLDWLIRNQPTGGLETLVAYRDRALRELSAEQK